MNTNENTHTDLPEDVIVLGVASVETQGTAGITENFGLVAANGISDA
jgi:hypothetical protein